MKNVTNASAKDSSNRDSHADAPIPDPAEWVYEHHCLANFLHSLTNLKQIWPDSLAVNCFDSEEDGEVAIDAQARDMLKANYSEDRWQYVENYLLVWDS